MIIKTNSRVGEKYARAQSHALALGVFLVLFKSNCAFSNIRFKRQVFCHVSGTYRYDGWYIVI